MKTLSEKNPYYLSKYRTLELKYFCMQYPIWLKSYTSLLSTIKSSSLIKPGKNIPQDSDVEKLVIARDEFKRKIDTIDNLLNEMELNDKYKLYLELSIKEGKTWAYLSTHYGVPSGMNIDTFYKLKRKFLWKLNKIRN